MTTPNNDPKSKIVDEIIEMLTATPLNTGDLLLVKKLTFREFLNRLPLEALTQATQNQLKAPPPIESDAWIDWFIEARKKLGIERDEVIRLTGIPKGDISRFESRDLEFGLKRRQKLLHVFADRAVMA